MKWKSSFQFLFIYLVAEIDPHLFSDALGDGHGGNAAGLSASHLSEPLLLISLVHFDEVGTGESMSREKKRRKINKLYIHIYTTYRRRKSKKCVPEEKKAEIEREKKKTEGNTHKHTQKQKVGEINK